MKTNKFLSSFCGVLLLTMACNVGAVRLGPLSIDSALGEPLKAVIPVYDVSGEDMSFARISLASPSNYDAAGLIYTDLIPKIDLRFELLSSGIVIYLTTTDPVNEVVIDLLIEFSIANERVSRTYVAFIDPPLLVEERRNLAIELQRQELATGPGLNEGQGQAEDVLEQEAATNISDQSEEVREPELGNNEKDRNVADLGSEVDPNAAVFPERKILVRPGDTLSKIAREQAFAGFSLEQLLVSIFRKNRDAFSGDNMNRLRAGKVLRMPTKSEVENVGRSDSISEVRIHAADWAAYRKNIASRENVVGVQSLGSGAGVESGEIRKSENVHIEQTSENSHVVEISGGGSTGKNDSGSALEERLLATEKALEEQKKRADELESIIADLRALSAATEVNRNTARNDNSNLTWQEHLIESVLKQPFYLLIPIGLFLVLGLWVSKKLNQDDILDRKEALKPSGADDDANIPDTQISPDEDARVPGLHTEGKDQGSIEDADIFMAYGRYHQAERILNEALAVEPKRLDLLLKLAEVYSRQKSLDSFTEVFEIIADVTRKTGGYWERALALGYMIDPNDPGFAEGRFASDNVKDGKSIDLSSIDLSLGSRGSRKPPKDD